VYSAVPPSVPTLIQESPLSIYSPTKRLSEFATPQQSSYVTDPSTVMFKVTVSLQKHVVVVVVVEEDVLVVDDVDDVLDVVLVVLEVELVLLVVEVELEVDVVLEVELVELVVLVLLDVVLVVGAVVVLVVVVQQFCNICWRISICSFSSQICSSAF
jgi:TRAP-type uncharacterized transport system fused permease subunit